MELRPPSFECVPCKICGNPSSLHGVVDFNRSTHEALPPSGVPIYYRHCSLCGFLFTDAFDDWNLDQFKKNIYNSDYEAIDPDYCSDRPASNAETISGIFGNQKNIRILDFGGGNDSLCSKLRTEGFLDAVTYDPMVPGYDARPKGKFDLVTCFETLEHVPNPIASIGEIVRYLNDPGAVFYTTVVQPQELRLHDMSWWYIGPRNGHISLFSHEALGLAWARYGFKNMSMDQTTHLAFKTLPKWNWESLAKDQK